MTVIGAPNRDAYTVTPDTTAMGPRVGFFESWNTAYETQMRTSSTFGIEHFMGELDDQQSRMLRDAGIEAPRLLDGFVDLDSPMTPSQSEPVADIGGYVDVARQSNNEPVDPRRAAAIAAYDKRIAELRAQRPDLQLRTSGEMFSEVRTKAQEAERKEATDRRTWGGAAGAFLGGTVASMDPRTDPFNFVTAGVGGAGRTAVARIGAQAGGQGVIEAVNQVTGVHEQRGLQGLSTGFLDGASRVGMAAVGGAALQGAGEVLAVGARRFFGNTPADPAPAPEVIAPPREAPAMPQRLDGEALVQEARVARLEQEGAPALLDLIADDLPLSGLRLGRPRVAADLNDMTAQLDAWDGGAPRSVAPRTAVAAYPGTAPRPDVDVSRAVESNQRYQTAKAQDPALFVKYEAILERVNTYRRWVGELSQTAAKDVTDVAGQMTARLGQLEAQLRTTQGKSKKLRLRQQIAEVRADQAALAEVSGRTETSDVARVRRELVKADQQMRELAPLLGRAYSRAEGRWNETEADINAVWDAYKAGRMAPEPTNSSLDPDVMMTLYDRVPMLQRAAPDTPADTPAVDVARQVVAKDIERLDVANETFRSQASRILTTEDEVLRVEGVDYDFKLSDKMFDENGQEVTLRKVMQDIDRANQEMEAITTCSIR